MPSEVQDPKVLYVYLSLSSGSSSIDTGLRVLERILKGHKIPFSLIDVSTDDKARSIWLRRKTAQQKLPALVKDGQVIGVRIDPVTRIRSLVKKTCDAPDKSVLDFKEVEEWNEYGELKQKLGLEAPSAFSLPQNATTSTVDRKPEDKQAVPSSSVAIAAEAAAAAAAKQKGEQK